MRKPVGGVPDRLLTPTKINEVWHMDFVQICVLWMTFYVAAILDGFSRKLLAFRVYRHTPRIRDALALVRETVKEHEKPNHLLTDHGCQFRQRFKDGLQNKLGIRLFQGPVRSPHWNGKVERIFRTFRLWWCLVLTGCTLGSVQRRLDDWRYWYNEKRIHSALGVRTPQEAWAGQTPPTPVAYRAREKPNVSIAITRTKCRGDPRLRVLEITLRQAA